MLKKVGWTLGLLAAAAGIVIAGWYSIFNKDISLPGPEAITRVEVRQNDFEQKVQQVTYLEDGPKIGKIREFLHQRRSGWERLLVTPPGVTVLVHFYGGDKALFHLYLMKNDRVLIGNKDGAFTRNIHKAEREEIERLLGIGTGTKKTP